MISMMFKTPNISGVKSSRRSKHTVKNGYMEQSPTDIQSHNEFTSDCSTMALMQFRPHVSPSSAVSSDETNKQDMVAKTGRPLSLASVTPSPTYMKHKEFTHEVSPDFSSSPTSVACSTDVMVKSPSPTAVANSTLSAMASPVATTPTSMIVDPSSPGSPSSSHIRTRTLGGSFLWDTSRSREFANKRLRLCQQRVQLEQRILALAQHEKAAAASSITTNTTATSPEQDNDRQEEDLEYIQHNFPDGQVYHGQAIVVRSKDKGGQMIVIRHGQGTNTWPDQQCYNGYWKDDHRHGRGTHAWPDQNRKVTGDWYNGQLHGRVFFVWQVTASDRDGSSSGSGTCTYDGQVQYGKRHGRGVQTWPNGRVYRGQYMAGVEHGFGTLTEPDQSKYRGQFRAGKRQGYGMQIWSNKTYDGEWDCNMVQGRGKLTWNNGACYIGEFQLGRYHGTGTYQDARNKKYVGSWCDGRKEGDGKQYWSDGRSYFGGFHLGKRHGYGRMNFPDGSLYTGGWEYGKRWGQGIQIGADGTVVHCGQWKDNMPLVNENNVSSNTCSPDRPSDQQQQQVKTPSPTTPLRAFDDLDIWHWGRRSGGGSGGGLLVGGGSPSSISNKRSGRAMLPPDFMFPSISRHASFLDEDDDYYISPLRKDDPQYILFEI